MSAPRFSIRHSAPARLTALGLLSLALMACGTTPQTPGESLMQSQMIVCPVEPLAAQSTQTNVVACDPPDPGPSPDPTPPPPAYSVTPDPNRPAVTPEMASALQQAGLIADPYTIGQTYTTSVPVALYTRRNEGETFPPVVLAGPKGSTLRGDRGSDYGLRIDIPSQYQCSWSVAMLPNGGSVQSRTEIDDIYGRAIDAALKVGNVDLALKLGQMRNYHLGVLNLTSDVPVIQVTFSATAQSLGPFKGKGGHCNGRVSADFVGH